MKSFLVVLVLAATVGAFAHREAAESYVCTARSLTGKRYSATGPDKALTQEAAMRKCEENSFRCYRTGCTP